MRTAAIIKDKRKVMEVKLGFIKCIQLMGERKTLMDSRTSLQMPRDL